MSIAKKKNIPKPTHFGKNLKFLRRMKGLSQTALANETGMTRNNIASYESGVVEPNASNFLRVCKFFSIDPKCMLDSVLSENPHEVTSHPDKVEGVVNNYLLDHMDQFVIQTNEMTKILEGYKALYDLRRADDDNPLHRDLYSTMGDLHSLLESLIKSNWNLISSVFPEEEE